MKLKVASGKCTEGVLNEAVTRISLWAVRVQGEVRGAFRSRFPKNIVEDQRGDVPGWVLVVLMTTGLVTAIWTIAAPRLSSILRSSLDAMNSIR